MTRLSPLRLLLLREHRPGEFNQTEGLAAAIARMTDFSVERIELRPRKWAHNYVRKFVLHTMGDAQRALQILYGVRMDTLMPPDVVIGAGRPTAAAGILIKRATGAKFLYSGFLRDYDLAAIDLLLVRSARHAGMPHCVLAPLPTTVDPDRLRRPRQLRSLKDLAGAEVGLLLGGPASGYRFSDGEWRRIAELVAETAEKWAIRWTISNSRRTPDLASRIFAELKARCVIQGFVDFRRSGPGSATRLFASDAIVTTEDLLTMTAEAMAARRPVVALKPAGVAPEFAADAIATMAAGGGLTVLPIRTTMAPDLATALVTTRVPQTDPRQVIADAIAPVLGLVNAHSQRTVSSSAA